MEHCIKHLAIKQVKFLVSSSPKQNSTYLILVDPLHRHAIPMSLIGRHEGVPELPMSKKLPDRVLTREIPVVTKVRPSPARHQPAGRRLLLPAVADPLLLLLPPVRFRPALLLLRGGSGGGVAFGVGAGDAGAHLLPFHLLLLLFDLPIILGLQK